MTEKILQWQEDMIRLFGFYAHYVVADDASVNIHTHGCIESWQHPDLQIVLPIGVAADVIFNALIDRVKAGERFAPGERADLVLTETLSIVVAFIAAAEGQRFVLRVILPDRQGRLDKGVMEAEYARQYSHKGV
jgi:hypothetical protein